MRPHEDDQLVQLGWSYWAEFSVDVKTISLTEADQLQSTIHPWFTWCQSRRMTINSVNAITSFLSIQLIDFFSISVDFTYCWMQKAELVWTSIDVHLKLVSLSWSSELNELIILRVDAPLHLRVEQTKSVKKISRYKTSNKNMFHVPLRYIAKGIAISSRKSTDVILYSCVTQRSKM